MEKRTFGEIIRYRFDNLMSKGAVALVGILFLATTVVIVLAGIIAFAMGNGSISQNIWASVMHTIDAGTITGTDTSDVSFLIIMSIVTLGGIFITSILIGIITTGFEEKLQSLKKGNSLVVEKDHTIILGFNENIYTIISELICANENRKDACIVVLSDEDKETMETAIAEQIDDCKNTRIICRTGNITDLPMLKKCSIDTCRSVIINQQEDFITTKAILAINSYFDSQEGERTCQCIVAPITYKANFEAATIAGEGNVELILVRDAISRIIAQTCRQPGLSNVLIELFDYSGSELYFEVFAEFDGKPFIETLTMFEQAVVFGYKRGDQVVINPDNYTMLQAGDSLILLVEDDGMAKTLTQKPDLGSVESLSSSVPMSEKPEEILVLGINEMLRQILTELDNYFVKGSLVTVANDGIDESLSDLPRSLSNIDIKFVDCDITSRENLDSLTGGDLSHVLLLSEDELDTETSDAITLLKLIHLRDIAQKQDKVFNITSQMKNAANQKLAKVAKANDLVIGSNIINLILTQISENRHLSEVFREILTTEGSEIYIRKASHYVKLHEPMNFYTVTAIVAANNEIAIGYKKQLDDTFEILLNPSKSEMITFEDQDYIVVLADD